MNNYGVEDKKVTLVAKFVSHITVNTTIMAWQYVTDAVNI